MASIDSILRMMVLRDAEAMTLASGQVPAMRRAGTVERMSMPALDAAMVAGFVDDLVAPDARAQLDARGSIEVVHAGGDGTRFAVAIDKVSGGFKLAVRKAGAAPAKAGPSVLATSKAPAATPPDPSVWSRRENGSSPAPVSVSVSPSVSEPVPVPVPVPASPSPSASLSPRLLDILSHASALSASDILLSASQPPRLRVGGELIPAPLEIDAPVDADEMLALLSSADRDALRIHGSVDLAIDAPVGRLRANVFHHHHGVGAALRLIRDHAPSLSELGLPDDLAEAVQHPSGLVLVCGPAGAGKSTTLAALVEHLNRTRARHIITLEQPIELQYTSKQCLVHQREIGVHAATFADGLRAALRESPDVLVVGELRDRDTISIALTAAETGHLVLGTMHAPGGGVAIDRVIDVFPEHQQRQVRVQLAAVLRTLITQHLLPTRTGGRAAAVERVIVTPAVAHLIRKSELQMLSSLVQSGREHGMIPLERSLARVVKDGRVAAAAARAVSPDPDLLDQLLRRGD